MGRPVASYRSDDRLTMLLIVELEEHIRVASSGVNTTFKKIIWQAALALIHNLLI